MKNMLSRIIKSYKQELDKEGYYEHVLKSLDKGLDELQDTLNELDNETLKFELIHAVLTAKITQNQLDIAYAPRQMMDYLLVHQNYFKTHGVFDDLFTGIQEVDKDIILRALRKIKDDPSPHAEHLAILLPDIEETHAIHLRGTLKDLIEFYNDED